MQSGHFLADKPAFLNLLFNIKDNFGLIVNGKFCTGWSIPRSKCFGNLFYIFLPEASSPRSQTSTFLRNGN
jgi:hypothetical protein